MANRKRRGSPFSGKHRTKAVRGEVLLDDRPKRRPSPLRWRPIATVPASPRTLARLVPRCSSPPPCSSWGGGTGGHRAGWAGAPCPGLNERRASEEIDGLRWLRPAQATQGKAPASAARAACVACSAPPLPPGAPT